MLRTGSILAVALLSGCINHALVEVSSTPSAQKVEVVGYARQQRISPQAYPGADKLTPVTPYEFTFDEGIVYADAIVTFADGTVQRKRVVFTSDPESWDTHYAILGIPLGRTDHTTWKKKVHFDQPRAIPLPPPVSGSAAPRAGS